MAARCVGDVGKGGFDVDDRILFGEFGDIVLAVVVIGGDEIDCGGDIIDCWGGDMVFILCGAGGGDCVLEDGGERWLLYPTLAGMDCCLEWCCCICIPKFEYCDSRPF